MVRVRGVVGPVLTTGVALAAAVVVVANPVIPPRSDVQIPSVQLSAGTGDALGMLYEEFLNAIAPEPPESTNPFVIIRDLISSLAADATYLGTNAIVDAFVAGATAVTQPELTASSTPYSPPVQPWISEPTLAGVTGLSLQAYLPTDLVTPSAVVNEIDPVVAEVVTAVINDVSFLGDQLVTAAFATGVMLAAEPGLIVDTLWALISGDVRGALDHAVKAVTAPLGPTVIIIDAIRTIVEQRLPMLPAIVLPFTEPAVPAEAPQPGASVPAAEVDGAAEAGVDAVAATTTAPDAAPREPKRRGPASEIKAVVTPVTGTPEGSPEGPVDAVETADTAEAVDIATDDLNTPKPGQRPARSEGIRDAVSAVQDAARTGLRDVGDAVRKATGRTAKAAAGPNAD